MQAQHPSSSAHKAITPPGPSSSHTPSRPLLATAMIGTALIVYLVSRTPDARQRLEGLTDMARTLGDLSARDTRVVDELLAETIVQPHPQGESHYVF